MQVTSSGKLVTELRYVGFSCSFLVVYSLNECVSREFTAYALDYLSNFHSCALGTSNDDHIKEVSYIIGMICMRNPSRPAFSLATTCGYWTSLEEGFGSSAFFHYDSIRQACRIPMNALSYNTFRSAEFLHHTGLCYTFDSEKVYLDARHLSVNAWGGSSTSDTSYSGRRDFAAARLWAGQAVSPRLTVADYVERVRNQSLVRLARRTPGAWDPASDRELVRQRNL